MSIFCNIWVIYMSHSIFPFPLFATSSPFDPGAAPIKSKSPEIEQLFKPEVIWSMVRSVWGWGWIWGLGWTKTIVGFVEFDEISEIEEIIFTRLNEPEVENEDRMWYETGSNLINELFQLETLKSSSNLNKQLQAVLLDKHWFT